MRISIKEARQEQTDRLPFCRATWHLAWLGVLTIKLMFTFGIARTELNQAEQHWTDFYCVAQHVGARGSINKLFARLITEVYDR